MLPLVIATLLSSCWGRPSPLAHAEDSGIIRQALAISTDDRQGAIDLLEGYLQSGTDVELRPVVALYAGEQRRLAGDLPAARDHFASIRRDHPDHAAADPAAVGLALVDYTTSGGSGNTLATLELVREQGLPDTMNADRYRVLALEADRDSVSAPVIRDHARKAMAYSAADPVVESRVHRSLAGILPDETRDLDELAPPAADEDVAALRRARGALLDGNHERARELALAFAEAYPDSEFIGASDWIERLAGAGNPYDADAVGVLLPLSGRFAPPGGQIKDALSLAAEGTGVELIFRDTGGEPEAAEEAFEALVLDKGVAAVIGPLLKDTAKAVARDAQDAGVPLLALTQTPGITDTGEYIFRGMMTVDHQIDQLLDHVMDLEGLRNLAIMAPKNSFGAAARESFLRQVAERGGRVVAMTSYEPTDTTFRQEAAELGNKNYEARKSELYRLQAQAVARGQDPSKVVLPPAADFDAIFIPDSAQRVALVAASLAYEEFAIGAFSPYLSGTPVPLLGLNGFNNPLLAVQGGDYVRNSIFVDAFDPDDDDPAVQGFVGDYEAAYGRTPGVLEALSFDAARLVFAAARGRPEHRDGFRDKMAGAGLGSWVAGGGEFDQDREIPRDMIVYTIDNWKTSSKQSDDEDEPKRRGNYIRRIDRPPL